LRGRPEGTGEGTIFLLFFKKEGAMIRQMGSLFLGGEVSFTRRRKEKRMKKGTVSLTQSPVLGETRRLMGRISNTFFIIKVDASPRVFRRRTKSFRERPLLYVQLKKRLTMKYKKKESYYGDSIASIDGEGGGKKKGFQPERKIHAWGGKAT